MRKVTVDYDATRPLKKPAKPKAEREAGKPGPKPIYAAGKMNKKISLWMHEGLFKQLEVEARFANCNVRDHMRKKLAAKESLDKK